MLLQGGIAPIRSVLAARELDGTPIMESRGRTWALRLTLGLGLSLAVCAAMPAGASACASLAGVKSFHGSAQMAFAVAATGEDPGEGGIETITLNRVATGLKVNLDDKDLGKKDTLFDGKVSGGNVSVGDTFNNSDDGFTGQETYNGPVTNSLPGYGSAFVTIDHRKNMCRYAVVIGYGATTEFSGDEEVKPPPTVGATASSGPVPVPDSLQLSDSRSLPAYLSCANETVPEACFDFGGGWMTEFATLALCHSVEAVNCSSDTAPVGTASFSWNLSPTFERHHRKK